MSATAVAVPSVEPSSTTIISMRAKVCARTERSVSCTVEAALYAGTMTETRGLLINLPAVIGVSPLALNLQQDVAARPRLRFVVPHSETPSIHSPVRRPPALPEDSQSVPSVASLAPEKLAARADRL
jgi:hypothetical protein